MRTAIAFATAALILANGAASTSIAAQTAAAPAPAPLTVTASCVVQAGAATLRIAVRNSSDRAVSFVPGFIAGTEKSRVVNSIMVFAIRPATGASEDFLYVSPKYALASGKLDPWVVPLAAGATFDLDLPVKDFISGMNYQPMEPAAAGGARLALEGKPVTSPGATGWTGTIEAPISVCQ
jgi:hypothetical protein